MDGRDLDIIAHLSRDPLAPLASLAKSARLTSNATRARIARLREQGVLMGVFAFPNPALFGKVARIAVYAPPLRAIDPADALDVDDVLSYSVNHDGQLAVTYYAATPDSPPPAALDKLAGAKAPRVFVREAPPLVPPGAALSHAQWGIVEAMLDDGRVTTRRIAEVTGLTERVVGRHRKKLVEGNQVTLVTGILSNLAEGIVLFHLFVAGPGTKDEASVLKAIGAAFVQERTRGPDGLYILCSGDSMGDALTARDRAASLAGIEHVELVLEKEAGVATERMRRLCRAQAKRS